MSFLFPSKSICLRAECNHRVVFEIFNEQLVEFQLIMDYLFEFYCTNT
jgi:hypothetical protein